MISLFSRILLIVLLAAMAVASKADNHFITNDTYRNTVSADFNKRAKLLKNALGKQLGRIARLEAPEREAMQFLYAYMPYNDMADYDYNFFLKQMRYAFRTRAEMPWGKHVPEDVFRHFVLPYRVNNENLDSARFVMFPILKERLKGMSMYDAALEVNHWCHEYVTYRPADIRTSAPLATMRTGLGRCGEESTFTVTALRAAGIPARQCYTPRWAHCDDNHAWVEVWIDGKWMFLGACEPDPELNMGWFSIPSTRCMMVHTKAFGRYHGAEEIIKETPLYSELNLLSHYSPVNQIEVTVVDKDGKPLANVDVKFKLYNYSEYYTLATVKSATNGKAFVTSGLGDLLIWATDGTRYNYAKLNIRQNNKLTIRLDKTSGKEYVEELDIVPPSASKAKVSPSKQKVIQNAHRLAYEDSLRKARMATFMCNQPRNTWNVDKNENITEQQLVRIISKSEGNHAEIASFLNRHTKKEKGLYLYEYLESYSDKDMRDITADVLEHHLTHYDGKLPLEVYLKGIMPARISNEIVARWRNIGSFKSPKVDTNGNYYNCPITPVGVSLLKHADPHSRNIYYVAACRANGIAAYLDNATNEIFKWNGKEWVKVTFDKTPATQTGTLRLTYGGTEPKVPAYYPHFTLQRFENGDFTTFEFEEDPRMSSFPTTLPLSPGYYCLSTGNRYPDGEVLSRMEFFNIEAGKETTKEITLRQLVANKAVAQPSVSKEIKLTADSIALADYAGVKGMIFINLGDYREPSKHLINEMHQIRNEFAAWGGNIFVITPDDALNEVRTFANADIVSLANESDVTLLKALLNTLGLDANVRYPFAAFLNNTGQILYHSEGYSIGSAEQLLKCAKQF